MKDLFEQKETYSKVVKLHPNEVTNDDLLWADATDFGNAKCLFKMFGQNFVYCDSWGLMFWDGKCWQSDTDKKCVLRDCVLQMMKARAKTAYDTFDGDPNTELKKSIQKAIGTSNAKINGTVEAFLALPEIHRDTRFFNRCKDKLNVKNGIVDLRTGKLIPHDPSYGFTWISPVDYDPTVKFDEWETFLQQVLFSYDLVKEYIQMAVGYTLSGETKVEKLFYLYGVTRSGKSTFLQAIQALMGEDIARGTSFTTFTKSRTNGDQGFDLATLHTARLIVATEGESQAKLNESVVKNITGNDELQAAYKGKDFFSFRPSWKIWLASNYKPAGSVTDDAFWYRLVLLVFPNSFVGKEDFNLKEKLTSPDMLSGILNWAVQGAVKWYSSSNGLLVVPGELQNALNAARNELDLVQQWIDDRCLVNKSDQDTFVSVKDANNDFENWCLDNGIDGWKKNTVVKVLSDKGFTVKSKRIPVILTQSGLPSKEVQKCVVGLKLLEKAEPWEIKGNEFA